MIPTFRIPSPASALAFAMALSIAAATGDPVAGQDKSASSVIQLPSAGGTVTREEGAFSLNNNTGSANFRLPLPELPQRGRFGPSVQLTYNQFAGDSGSGLGVGWGFTVPSITVNDDLGTAIAGTQPDGDFFSRLSFMGTRLVFLGRDGGLWRYRPEFSELAVEILYHPQPFEVVTLGPLGEDLVETVSSGFEVLNPDGTRMIFSGDPAVAEGNFDAPTPYATRWPLVMHLNPDRDVIRYDYTKDGGRSYLNEIAFAGGESTYRFELIDTLASLVSHATGSRQVNARLYGKVTASFDDTVYGQWCMGYIGRSAQDNAEFTVRAHPDCQTIAERDLQPLIDENSVTVLDQLRVLYRYGDTNSAPFTPEAEHFPGVTLDYSSWTGAELAARNLVFEAPNMAWAGDVDPWTLELADLNMDALVDVVRTTDDGASVFLGEGDLDAAFERALPLVLSRTTDAGLQREITPRLADDRFHFADIFGDSYIDIVEIEDGVMHVYDGKADGTFPYLGRSVALPGISPTTFADGNGRFKDLNMDGKSDIVTTRLDAEGRTEWVIFLNLTRRQPDGGYLVNFGALTRDFAFQSQDGQILGRPDTQLTDINGDRLPDLIVIRPADEGFCLYENQGNLFVDDPDALLFGDAGTSDPRCGAGRFAPINGLQPTDNLQTMWYVDANGDGIMDFAAMGSRTDQLRVWLGFGNGSFLIDPLEMALNLRVQVGASSQSFRSRVADLDADGQSEIVVFQKPSGTDVRPVVVIDFNRTETAQLVKANLLTTVSFDSGRRHDIRYATSTDEMLRDRAEGRETRSLHFPVVVAKQMVTSEGVPGQIRDDVQTEEFYYHLPFYDIINNRFIGFTEIEKVMFGDEFQGAERTTQTSSITREEYYTFAETAVDLHLAGKLRVRKIYELAPDPMLLASAAATITLDPSAPTLHSLSSETRREALPEEGEQLHCESEAWEAVPRGDGSSFLRRTAAHLSTAIGADQMQDPADDECRNPIKVQSLAEFDDFNLPHLETVMVRDLTGPLDLPVPGFELTTMTEYDSRDNLAELGIVTAVSERRVLSGTELLSREHFTYLPDFGGRMGSRTLDVFSGLGTVPDPLADRFRPTHSLTKTMDYDVFGNILAMSDDFGMIEAASFDPTGTLPLSHTRFAGGDERFDQVMKMQYDGSHAGLMAKQITPLGLEVSFEYDALARKTSERAEDGAERIYRYSIGEDGRPSMILTAQRRYATAAETPEGESEWIEELAAYNSRGNQIAELENAAGGGVRVYNFLLYNRNERKTFRWTPFTTEPGTGPADVEAVFSAGTLPRPEHEIGNSYTYDGAGRMIRETHPSGKVSILDYLDWGTRRVTAYDDQFDGRVTVEEWRLGNENGMTALVASDGDGTAHVSRFVRDSFGYLREIWLPQETEPRRFVFNSIGDVEHQSIPGMGDIFYLYDSRGRQSAKAHIGTGGEIRVLDYEYDFLNRKTAEVEDGELRVEIMYDDGVQTVSANPFGDAIALPLDKITQIKSHDPNGRFDATQRFAYDRNGRVIQHETEIAGDAYAESYHRTLDARIDRSSGPRGLSSHFSLGPDQNLHSITIDHPSFAGPEMVIEDVGYNPEGRIDHIGYRMGGFTDLVYDRETLFLKQILTEAGGIALQDLSMTFNGNGSITEIVDGLAADVSGFGHVDRSGTFGYDFKNQLIRYDRYGEESGFDYSPAGSFSRNDDFAEGAPLAPPAGAVTALIPIGAAGFDYTFDGFGQLATSPAVTGTTFDAYGRLIRAQTEAGEVFFGYDQAGRRLYKQLVPADAPDDALLYLYPLESFEAGPKGEESYVNVGTARLVRMEHETGRWFYYLKDHLESSDYVMASDGTPVEQMLYRAYGTEHQPEILKPDWAAHVEEVTEALPRERTHHRFTGKYLDDETGLYYYGARYYDPALGRFISPDPLYVADPEACVTNPLGCNLFSYANNNPMAFIDPTGLKVEIAELGREGAEEQIRRIDPTARVDSETGEISQSWLHGIWLDIKDFFVPGSGHDAGRELVSRLIESEQTTTIEYAAGTAWATNKDSSVDPTTTPGDVTVGFDPSLSVTLPEFDSSTGDVNEVPVDPAIALGHELIHATHRMAGQHAGWDPVNYTALDGTAHTSKNEETRTVGLGGTQRDDDITENDLREMMGINPRNNYSAF